MKNKKDTSIKKFSTGFVASLLGIFFGALLGAFFGYLFTIHEKTQEIKAKREILLKELHNQLTFIGEGIQSYDATKVIYRDPIRLSVPAQLLDGETLKYETHEALIRSLLKFQVAVTKYNDLVQTTNLIQNIPIVSDTAHRQIYENIIRFHQEVLITRDEVIKSIPP